MNSKDAAVEVLRREGGGPMSVSEVAQRVLDSGLVALGGKTPKDTVAAQLYVEARKADGRFERVSRGMIRLR
jgi:hypothetical protein